METLPTTTVSSCKSERRGRSSKYQNTSKPSVIMAFFSCVAWLYVAGRLWQDSENRVILNNMLKKNYDQKPKVLTVDDKLMVLGCKDLERKIVETEMELTLAKSQGYLKSGPSSGMRLLAVIGVYTGFGSHLRRNSFRGSWMPQGDALKKLEERGVVIRFVIGRSPNRGDSLDRKIDEEDRARKDFLILSYLSFVIFRYFRHAAGSLIILSKNLAQYININSGSLKTYAFDDTSIGSWMIGVQATYIDDNRLCCSSIRQDKVCSVA
ncbi:hypothetical protein DY000_02057035 [Brassica cretica]|uniref:Hexosyltransferase n=1 Tax=Brassica cretica TaxID=69181 RepID=A0ABQ7A639_BRACR|nr:hypothetical protein DY000_02057035 [Brassica cretica]